MPLTSSVTEAKIIGWGMNDLELEAAMKHIGKIIRVNIPYCNIGGEYILINLRRYKRTGNVSAVCKDTRAKSSVIICRLENVEEIRSPKEIKKT